MTDTRPTAESSADERVLNDRYRLLEPIGSGGMGTVHRARDLRLGREVAVKLLRTSAEGDADHRRRLEAEATIAASLRHPSIAQVFDHAEDQASPDRTPFVVMELVEGVTLAQLLRERGALPWDQTLAVVKGVAAALSHLEAHGVVHRDLKPANIMLTTDSRVVLVDFGVARAQESAALTSTGVMLGTVEYLSPEQIGGASATAASDLYALGLVAHGCLTGSSPYRRSSAIATAWAQVNDELPRLSESVPPAVRSLVTALASKEPAGRPVDADTVVRTIDALGLTLDLPRVGEADVASTPAPVSASLDRAPTRAVTIGAPVRPRRSRWLAAGSLTAVALVAALLLTGEGGSPSVADPPATSDSTDTAETAETTAPEPTDPVPTDPVPTPVESVPTPVVATQAPSTQPAPANAGASRNTNGNGNGNANANANGNAGGKAR
ncbi:serine/threonine-protein kinase [Aeromicrobium sp.]|uniref:serine/threonine-protein kinase n=1 Tax=Aeromicrobium sp. TaxID=1871063 RepID=UPI0025BBD5DF|nr:serine/threonine-protein kinase [Aeromicrobium sp.]MCK5890469.1 serine/threonine protein kinase [Aeromicrobium sp.]